MPAIHKQLQVPYSAQRMYELVNDIHHYPAFLPWCKSSEIISQQEHEMRAKLVIAAAGFEQAFTTHNHLQPHKLVELSLIDGPFKYLKGRWQFQAVTEHSCLVILDLEFEFINKLFSLAIGPLFTQATQTLIDAFYQRAQDVYED